MLQLQIGFPSGRYGAAHHANPREPEWPPHPSRVYSALVAAAWRSSGGLSGPERRLLDALAQAGPPAMAFPDADTRAAPDSYVPVNDTRSRWSAERSPGVLAPNRQVRQFPTACLLGPPEVSLYWDLDLPAEDLAVLDRLASRMTHVGTSHAFVTARFRAVSDRPAVRWVPDADGREHLRVALAGRLDELERQFADRADDHAAAQPRRPLPACETLQAYRPTDRQPIEVTPAGHDWIAFRLDDAAWSADRAHLLARAARAALMALLGHHAPAALHGHGDDVDPAAPVRHVAWLPLPDVGHARAWGRIHGLAVGLPRSLSPDERASLLDGLQRLTWLHLPDGQTARLAPVIETLDTPHALRRATWCRASATWTSVTPVLLDRPPKRAEADLLLRALVGSLTTAGLPLPVEATLARTSAFHGAPAALDIPTRLPRYHATVRFAGPVEGPVIAGRWRHFGIGLFRPAGAKDPA